MVRGQVDDVRKKERELRRIIVDKCGYPQEKFIADFSGRDKNGNAWNLAQPEVDRKTSRCRQELERRHGPQHPAGAGPAAKADGPADRRWWCRWMSSKTSTSA
jgi:hypothetical protein